MEVEKELFNLSEAATYLGISVQTINNLRKRGDFPPVICLTGEGRGAVKSVRKSDLLKWLKTKERKCSAK